MRGESEGRERGARHSFSGPDERDSAFLRRSRLGGPRGGGRGRTPGRTGWSSGWRRRTRRRSGRRVRTSTAPSSRAGRGRRASGAGRAPARGGGPAARSRPPRREVFEREATRREGVATDRATRGEAVAAKPLERACRRRPARRARGGPRRRAEAPRARRDAPRPKPTHVSIAPARDREGRREDAAAREHADRGTRRARDRPNAGSCRNERRGSLRARVRARACGAER